MPVPFRITNRSTIPIQFHQTDVREELIYLRTVIQPSQSIDYALDEPTLKPLITCSIADGTKANYDLLKLGTSADLNYQNNIYIAFQETFESDNFLGSSSEQLVIEYANNQLLLRKRQENKCSQLWQMTSSGLLMNMGLSSRLKDDRHTIVLDIEDATENILKQCSHWL